MLLLLGEVEGTRRWPPGRRMGTAGPEHTRAEEDRQFPLPQVRFTQSWSKHVTSSARRKSHQLSSPECLAWVSAKRLTKITAFRVFFLLWNAGTSFIHHFIVLASDQSQRSEWNIWLQWGPVQSCGCCVLLNWTALWTNVCSPQQGWSGLGFFRFVFFLDYTNYFVLFVSVELTGFPSRLCLLPALFSRMLSVSRAFQDLDRFEAHRSSLLQSLGGKSTKIIFWIITALVSALNASTLCLKHHVGKRKSTRNFFLPK